MENEKQTELKADWLKTKERVNEYWKMPEGETMVFVVGESVVPRTFKDEKTGKEEHKTFLDLTIENGQLFQGRKIWSIEWKENYTKRSLFGQLKDIVMTKPTLNLVGCRLHVTRLGTGKQTVYLVRDLNPTPKETTIINGQGEVWKGGQKTN